MTKKILMGIIVAIFVVGIGTAYAGLSLPTIMLDGNVVVDRNLDMTNGKISNLATPTIANDAATKDYVDTTVILNSLAEYVTFQTPSTIATLATEICDAAGGAGQQHQLRIDGGSDFMVTGIIFKPTGVDQGSDSIVIAGIFLDGQNLAIRTGDLTGTFATSFGFDIAGVPTITGGNVPTSITATGAGSQDIVIAIQCFAGTTTDITFPAGSIIVSGWKLTSDTITAAYD